MPQRWPSRIVTVIDTNGGAPQHDMTVVIRENHIAEITDKSVRAAKIMDGRGKFLIPGLWDMHVHLSWTTPSALPVLVANSV